MQLSTSVKIPLDWPNIGEREKSLVQEALNSGWVSTAGPLVNEFETKFAASVGSRYAVSTASGTAGLHLALRLLGVGPGDEVIIPALTFIATLNPVLYVGATPIVVDVDPVTWTMDPDEVIGAVSERTKVIIPVHVYGNPTDMQRLKELAHARGILIVEDATEALGASLGGTQMGTWGDIGVFSFNGNKIITTGNGGMLVTDNADLAERAQLLVNQGRSRNAVEYEYIDMGYNYRLSNIQAALGLAQLERLPEFVQAKKRNADIYRERLSILNDRVGWQKELPGSVSTWWLFSITIDGFDIGERNSLMRKMKDVGIQVRPLFLPLPQQPYLSQQGLKECPVAKKLHREGINLPSATFLDGSAVEAVCDFITQEASLWSR